MSSSSKGGDEPRQKRKYVRRAPLTSSNTNRKAEQGQTTNPSSSVSSTNLQPDGFPIKRKRGRPPKIRPESHEHTRSHTPPHTNASSSAAPSKAGASAGAAAAVPDVRPKRKYVRRAPLASSSRTPAKGGSARGTSSNRASSRLSSSSDSESSSESSEDEWRRSGRKKAKIEEVRPKRKYVRRVPSTSVPSTPTTKVISVDEDSNDDSNGTSARGFGSKGKEEATAPTTGATAASGVAAGAGAAASAAASAPPQQLEYIVNRFYASEGAASGVSSSEAYTDARVAEFSAQVASLLAESRRSLVKESAAVDVDDARPDATAAGNGDHYYNLVSQWKTMRFSTVSFLLSHPYAFLAYPFLSLYDPAHGTSHEEPENDEKRIRRYALTASANTRSGGHASKTHDARSIYSNIQLYRRQIKSVIVPLVVGNAVRLTNPESRTKSHSWTVYVRGLHNGFPHNLSPNSKSTSDNSSSSDNNNHSGDYLSQFIDHVDFVLDKTFTPFVRRVRSPPFEVTEVGWGEFIVYMHVYLRNFRETEVFYSRAVSVSCADGGAGFHRREESLLASRTFLKQHIATQLRTTTAGAANLKNASTAGTLRSNSATSFSQDNAGASSPVFPTSPATPVGAPQPSSTLNSSNAIGSAFEPGSPNIPSANSLTTITTDPSAGGESLNGLLEDNLEEINKNPALRSLLYRGPFLPPDEILGAQARYHNRNTPCDREQYERWRSKLLLQPEKASGSASRRRSGGVKKEAEEEEEGGEDGGGGDARPLSSSPTTADGAAPTPSCVVLQHLLRFSHRPIHPPLVPPFGDRRGLFDSSTGTFTPVREQFCYSIVPDPIVSENYDELVIPLHHLDYDGEGAGGGERDVVVTSSGAKPSALPSIFPLICRLETSIRMALQCLFLQHIRSTNAALYTQMTGSLHPGGISCWEKFNMTAGDVMKKDFVYCLSYLRSVNESFAKDVSLYHDGDTVTSLLAEGLHWNRQFLFSPSFPFVTGADGGGAGSAQQQQQQHSVVTMSNNVCVPLLTSVEFGLLEHLFELSSDDGFRASGGGSEEALLLALFSKVLLQKSSEIGEVILLLLDRLTQAGKHGAPTKLLDELKEFAIPLASLAGPYSPASPAAPAVAEGAGYWAVGSPLHYSPLAEAQGDSSSLSQPPGSPTTAVSGEGGSAAVKGISTFSDLLLKTTPTSLLYYIYSSPISGGASGMAFGTRPRTGAGSAAALQHMLREDGSLASTALLLFSNVYANSAETVSHVFANGDKWANFGEEEDILLLNKMKANLAKCILDMRVEIAKREAVAQL